MEENNSKPEEYLSMEQASRISGYHADYLGQLAREGKLKAEKHGHDWITTSTALNEYLSKHHATDPRANLAGSDIHLDDHTS